LLRGRVIHILFRFGVLETLPLGHVPEFTVYAGFTHTLCRRKPQKTEKSSAILCRAEKRLPIASSSPNSITAMM
jgi:hypothetical protein